MNQKENRKEYQKLKRRIQEVLILSYDEKSLKEKLRKAGFGYYRRGNMAGVIETSQKKKLYSLKRLGLDSEFQKLKSFEREQEKKKKESEKNFELTIEDLAVRVFPFL